LGITGSKTLEWLTPRVDFSFVQAVHSNLLHNFDAKKLSDGDTYLVVQGDLKNNNPASPIKTRLFKTSFKITVRAGFVTGLK
jgi:hypothetical protein